MGPSVGGNGEREGTGDANGLRWLRGWLDGEVPALLVPAIGDLHVLNLGPSPLITYALFFLLVFLLTSVTLNSGLFTIL